MTKLESVVVPKNSGRAFVVKKGQGDQLMSKLNNPMLTVEDTFKEGRHDLQKRMCSRKRFDLVAQGLAKRTFAEGVDPNPKKPEEIPDHDCLENLSEAVKAWNISPEDIPSPFNIFQMHVHRPGDRHHVQHDDSSEGRSACRLLPSNIFAPPLRRLSFHLTPESLFLRRLSGAKR